jgi:hypothetical protein
MERDELTAQLMTGLWASPGTLLYGWAQIARYCHKAPRTLRRYQRIAAFPVFRWGRHVYSDGRMISAWLGIYAEDRAKLRMMGQAVNHRPDFKPNIRRRGRRPALGDLSDDELRARLERLEKQLAAHAKDGKYKT